MRVLPLAMLVLVGGAALAADPASSKADWPKTIALGEREVILDAPHAESLEGTALKARGTFGLVRKGDTEPTWGSIWYDADVSIDPAQRSVTLDSVRVPRVQLAGMGPLQEEKLAVRLGQAITRHRIGLRLDDVLASARLSRRNVDGPPKLGTDPPAIVFESEPAVLVLFDGEPRFHAIDGSKLERAMNTAFLVVHDPGANAYWLDGGTMWFRAADVHGPWTKADEPPAEALAIAKRDREAGGVSEKEMSEKPDAPVDPRTPKILVATSPTELIVSDGAPRWTGVVDGRLEAMDTSGSDVFRTTADGKVWLVLSGRWYRSDALTGPWVFVAPDALPGVFREIPSDSPKAEVLAFVPGTATAREALEDAATPRTAAIRRKDAHVDVTYDGEPRFEAVPGTQVEYALNTPAEVLRIHGRYYAVDQGVWFTAAAPAGPWLAADSVPEQEIQAIPPESPVYNTRYVTVYDATPEVVYTAYTPAYLGSYPYYGTVVFGTGWAYRPWWGAYYYPRPFTWGYHAFYRPWVGWGYGFAWRPAWAGFRWGFGWGWGARWCGPGGFYRPAFAGAALARNVSITRNVNVTRNVYNSGANRTRVTGTTATSRTEGSRAATARSSSRTSPAAKGDRPEEGRAKAGASHAGSAKKGKAHAGGGARKR